MTSVVKSEPLIDVCIELFMERMNEFAHQGQSVDLATWLQWYAFDVIGELYFSSMFGFMRERTDYRDYIASLDILLPVLCAASVMPTYLRGLFLSSGMLLSSARKALKALQNIEQASATCVQERLQSNIIETDTREDFLGKLLAIHENKGKEQDFDIANVQTEVYSGL